MMMNIDEEYWCGYRLIYDGYFLEVSRDKNEFDFRIFNIFMLDMNFLELWNIFVVVRNENCSNLLEIFRKL